MRELAAEQNRDLGAILEMLDPKARDDLSRVLIHDRADRHEVSRD
jgi:hypothetical protein